MNYLEKIKSLQLDGTLNQIRDDIDERQKKEFNKSRENPEYKVQYFHFIDELTELLNADNVEEINFLYYDLITNDEEFIGSYKEYTDEKERLKKIKGDKWIKEFKKKVDKSPQETKDTLLELFNKYEYIFK